MKKIKLGGNNDKYALVDNVDFEWLNQWKWSYSGRYACRAFRKDGKTHTIRMHRLINNTPDGLFTDHINQNKLDNRRSNLRTADRSLNMLNRPRFKNNTSGYRGIDYNRAKGKWRFRLQIQKKQQTTHYFATLEDAIEYYKTIRRDLQY